MVVKGAGVHGSEGTGAEETTIQAAATAGSAIATAGRLGIGIINAGVQAVKNTVENRKGQSVMPELQGALYQGYRDAFIDNGVPQEIAEEAAAGLVQNEDAENNEAIAEANRIVRQGVTQKPAMQEGDTSQPVVPLPVAQASAIQPPQALSVANGATSSQKAVVFDKPPAQMTWPELQKAARAIAQETGQKPGSGKKVDIEPFVTHYWQEQQQEKTAVAAAPVVRTPVQRDEEPLETSYSTALEAAGADSEIASKAGQALVEGKGADNNTAVAEASKQVKQTVTRSKLHQMYYDVLIKQKGITEEMADSASKDLADGKGAHSSLNIRNTHDRILNRELETSNLDPFQRNWSQYSRHVTEQEPRKRDYLIAKAALNDGVGAKDVKAMVRWNSPVTKDIGQTQGSTASVNYADSITSALKVESHGKRAVKSKHVTKKKTAQIGG